MQRNNKEQHSRRKGDFVTNSVSDGHVRRVSNSFRAGLVFPVGRIGRLMRNGKYCTRTGMGAPIMLAAVMEFLCAEVLEISGEVCKDSKKKRITPRHIEIAVRSDRDFEKFFQNKTFANAGIVPPHYFFPDKH